MMNPNKGNSSLNTLVGIIDNALSSVSTAMPVTVIQVYDNHTVDVAPMIDMLDNEGNAVEHAPISGIPYARLQGGEYGLIIKPKVGDKGLVVFASRDISDVVQSKGKAKPASLRKHSMSDGMYIASLLYEEPKTYMEITKDVVSINVPTIGNDGNVDAGKDATSIKVTKNSVYVAVGSGGKSSNITIKNNNLTIESTKITLKGDVEITGNTTIGKDATINRDATIGTIAFSTHVHKVIEEGLPTKGPIAS
ncbi:Gp138 family membrane-puncturing spike protein [Commensalibacter papalotli (ex Botero et al. 2024)]|uniref:Phage protein Gp138 N-terminal domain-containing protein n=1 Tax=Commensalibacter papalotli (ex Botero et al. 2024) TaxID=2972766 RepID=A0ABM9HLG7_9PROT|nr:Gp138 family membrane-puncturing spike protein [Commensalibacter papalotli (ex Botero et al. 2024)]CAI3931890.1 unnamed protein product [Commensalibacter papalotli (ex Botero et al. 2024)]CAI3946819.1 unnamed protein product [Commensalibacter papalotli (ex Botero et al. 2024)]